MKALIQRVEEASVKVDESEVARIGKGILLFLGVQKGDSERDITYLVRKVAGLRIFEDPHGRMNLSVRDVGGEALVVSQFTLVARTKKGLRPSFDDAEQPERAAILYKRFIEALRAEGVKTSEGVFGSYMKVSLVNDGPVTIIIDTRG